jgi:hypothetical protein
MQRLLVVNDGGGACKLQLEKPLQAEAATPYIHTCVLPYFRRFWLTFPQGCKSHIAQRAPLANE